MSQDPLVVLAEQAIREYVGNGTVISPTELPESTPRQAGCFVSLHMKRSGELRGCIGTIEPTQSSLAEEIIQNAISASTRDPRFPPVDKKELDDLRMNVDVLFPPEPAQASDLDEKRYGVIVSQGFKRGLLLPDLDGVDSVEHQLQIACMKAGINPLDEYELERFEVARHQ